MTTEIPPFDAEVFNSIPWVRVDNELALPNLALMLEQQLAKTEGSTLDFDDAVVGEQITRQLKEQKGVQRSGVKAFRLSSAGACLRRLAQDFHGVPHNGFEGDGSARLVFAVGDAVEALVAMALIEALSKLPSFFSLSEALHEQRTVWVHVQVGDDPWMAFRVPGHPDGLLQVPRWRKGETPQQAWEAFFTDPVFVALEFKSMSDFGFKKMREKGIESTDPKTGAPDGYYYQNQSYQLAHRQEGRPVSWGYLIAFGKMATAKDAMIHPDFAPPKQKDGKDRKTYRVENSMLWSKAPSILGAWIPQDDEVQREIVHRFRQVALSESPESFPRILTPADKGTNKGKIGFPCDWCPHLFNCWPNARQVADRKGWFNTVTKITTLVE